MYYIYIEKDFGQAAPQALNRFLDTQSAPHSITTMEYGALLGIQIRS
jgi:hypothetical protein